MYKRQALVRTQFKRSFNDYPENLFKYFDYDAFAAATIGQVHHAKDFNSVHLVVKVQYPNVKESISNDIKLLEIFGKKLFKKVNFEDYLKEVNDTFLEETNYLKEGKNIQQFKRRFAKDNLIFQDYKISKSNNRNLTITFLRGFFFV